VEVELLAASATEITMAVPVAACDLASSSTPAQNELSESVLSVISGSVAALPVTGTQVDVPKIQTYATPSCSKHRVSLAEISPVPLPLVRESKRKSKQKRSEILTASSMKPILEEKKAKQEKEKGEESETECENQRVEKERTRSESYKEAAES